LYRTGHAHTGQIYKLFSLKAVLLENDGSNYKIIENFISLYFQRVPSAILRKQEQYFENRKVSVNPSCQSAYSKENKFRSQRWSVTQIIVKGKRRIVFRPGAVPNGTD
jgi:hypothetical protein